MLKQRNKKNFEELGLQMINLRGIKFSHSPVLINRPTILCNEGGLGRKERNVVSVSKLRKRSLRKVFSDFSMNVP